VNNELYSEISISLFCGVFLGRIYCEQNQAPAMIETCDYCGCEDVCCSQGAVRWCRSERCRVLHQWATYEPAFGMPLMYPTLWVRLGAWLMLRWFAVLTLVVRGRWVLRKPHDLRQRLACWVYSGCYYWAARKDGWV